MGRYDGPTGPDGFLGLGPHPDVYRMQSLRHDERQTQAQEEMLALLSTLLYRVEALEEKQ